MTLLVHALVITAMVVGIVWSVGFVIEGWDRRGWE